MAIERAIRLATRRGHRYNPRVSPDGGARRGGRIVEARLAFEKMLTHANHVVLYAEQIGRAGQQQGNFPPGADRLALISAALNLDRGLGA